MPPAMMAEAIKTKIIERQTSLAEQLQSAYEALETRAKVSRATAPLTEVSESSTVQKASAYFAEFSSKVEERPRFTSARRQALLQQLSERSKSKEDATMAAVSIEAWSLGIQTIAVELPEN
jgi:hypothetical protein